MKKSTLLHAILIPMAHGEETEKTVVRPDTEKYTKSKSANGSSTLHNGDVVATGLASLTLGETFAIAGKLLGLEVSKLELKYAHLNLGMQRMNLGNRIRGAIAIITKGNAKEIAKIEKANTKLINDHQKVIDKSISAHEKLVKGAKEGVEVPAREVIEGPKLADVPELVEGAGDKAFVDAIAEFGDAIEKRKIEAELADKEKADKKAKDAKAKAIAKDAKAKAKAIAKDAKAKAKADAGTDIGTGQSEQ